MMANHSIRMHQFNGTDLLLPADKRQAYRTRCPLSSQGVGRIYFFLEFYQDCFKDLLQIKICIYHLTLQCLLWYRFMQGVLNSNLIKIYRRHYGATMCDTVFDGSVDIIFLVTMQTHGSY